MSEISILLVGDSGRSEFREAHSALSTWGPVTSVAEAEAAAVALSDGRLAADVIVVAQALPGQFSHRAIDGLRRSAPLARVLGLLGSWCEGELRTGEPWPGVIRIYWHQWPARCHQELARMQAGESSGWGLPVTATEEERLLLAAGCPELKRQGLIAVYTPCLETQEWLSDALRRFGCSTVWLRPSRAIRVEGAAAAIFDGSQGRGEELGELEHLAAGLRPAPIVALLDFPRIEDHRRAMAAGAAAVLSKPLQLEDLLWQLDRLL